MTSVVIGVNNALHGVGVGVDVDDFMERPVVDSDSVASASVSTSVGDSTSSGTSV